MINTVNLWAEHSHRASIQGVYTGRFISKKQGVAHAEASFLGGREKQNGLVDVQWEKGVKK